MSLLIAALALPLSADEPANLKAWVQAAELSQAQRAEALGLIDQAPLRLPGIQRLASLIAEAAPEAQALLADNAAAAPPESPLPDDPRAVVHLRIAASHFVARRYEEALTWLKDVPAESSLSPELVYYYKAVAHHQLADIQQAGQAAEKLLEIKTPTAARTKRIALMIQRDATAHKAGSLPHIAQMMGDVRRRLRLSRAGEENQAVQQTVIDALDKLIDKEEQRRKQQQQQQQQQSGGAQKSGTPGSRPMDESRPGEFKGKGDVDERTLPPGGDWGSLPPAERERVTQQIIRDFPAHYREVIEDYFRSLAEQPAQQEGKR